jgi:hypothetical protein
VASSNGAGLRALWAGGVPLPAAFWRYGIVYGAVANAAATLAAFALVAAGAPAWPAVAVFLLPVPYNSLIVVGVFRAARRWQGRPVWRDAARLAIVAWALALTAL